MGFTKEIDFEGPEIIILRHDPMNPPLVQAVSITTPSKGCMQCFKDFHIILNVRIVLTGLVDCYGSAKTSHSIRFSRSRVKAPNKVPR